MGDLAQRAFTAQRRALWPLLGLALGWALGLSATGVQLERAWQDFALRESAPPPREGLSLVIDIDAASMAALQPRWGAWPWPREAHAEIAQRLFDAGAEAVVFNLLLADPRPGDAALAQLARVYGKRVVFAASGLHEAPVDSPGATTARALSWTQAAKVPGPHWAALQWPDAEILAGGPGLGVLTTTLDGDGLLRCAVLVHHGPELTLPSLVLAAIAPAHPALRLQTHELELAPWRLQLDARGCLVPRLSSRTDGVAALPVLPLQQLLSAAPVQRLDDRLRGRVVFVGSPSLLDARVMTPWGQVAGTTWQALAADALRSGRVLGPATAWWDALLLALAALPALVWGWWRDAPRRFWALASAGLALLMAGASYAVVATGWGPLALVPALALLGGGALGLAFKRGQALAAARQRAELERAAAELASQAKTDFLAHMSHEIRTPLNAVLGMGQLLAETALTPAQQRHVDVFRSAGEHLRELLDEILDLARIEAGELHLLSEPLSPARLLSELGALFEARAKAKGLALRLDVDAALPPGLRGDRQRLRQMLINLLGNAIKFTDAGEVSLHSRFAPEGWIIEVRDTGVGIDPEQLDAVFEPFKQAHTRVASRFGGSGLGLAITRRLAHAMGGEVTMQSQPGQGTQVRLLLPLPICDAPIPAPPTRAPTPAAAAALQGQRLLVAEDNANNVLVLRGLLQDSGAQIAVVGDGQAAVDAAQAGDWDLILMDLRMPLLDGLSATRQIRRDERAQGRRAVPIVALSASVLASEVQASLDAGCTSFLGKPLDKAQLLERLHSLLVRAESTLDADTTPAVMEAAAPETLPAALDLVGAVQRLGGDAGLYERLRRAAMKELDAWEPRFAAAATQGDDGLCRRMAHDLKGLAATLGAQRLAEHAAQLERECIERGAACGPPPAAFSAELSRVRQILGEAQPPAAWPQTPA